VGFIDRLEGNRHIVILYDDEKQADYIIARYFMGASKGVLRLLPGRRPSGDQEEARCARNRRQKIRERKTPADISNPSSDSGEGDVLKTLKAIISESTRGMEPPFRFVGRTIIDIESVNGMELGMNLEKIGNDHFEEFDIALLCFYDIRKMERSRRDEWVRGLIENHNSVIYASEPSKSVAFETALLEEAE
jgi:hypothetical protein